MCALTVLGKKMSGRLSVAADAGLVGILWVICNK